MSATRTRLGRLEARQPETRGVAVVATRVEADSILKEAEAAGSPSPTVIGTGVSRADPRLK